MPDDDRPPAQKHLGHKPSSLLPYRGRLGSGPQLVGRIGSGVRVSASIKNIPTGFRPIRQQRGVATWGVRWGLISYRAQ